MNCASEIFQTTDLKIFRLCNVFQARAVNEFSAIQSGSEGSRIRRFF